MKKSQLIFAGIVFVVLLLITLVVVIDPYEKYKPSSASVKLPDLKKDGITMIEIVNPDDSANKTVTLVKEGEFWSVSGPKMPGKFKADKPQIDGILDRLASLEITAESSTKKDRHEVYEVDAKKGIKLIATNSKGEKLNAMIGKNAQDMSGFIVLPPSDSVYSVKSGLRSLVDKDANGWRDKTIFALDKAKVNKIEINDESSTKTGKLTLVKSEDGTWSAPDKPGVALDKTKVESLITQISSLRAQDFIDNPESPAKYELDNPAIVVKVTVEGAGEEALLVGSKNEKNVYAVKNMKVENPLYQLPSYQIERYQKGFDYYLPKTEEKKEEKKDDKKAEVKDAKKDEKKPDKKDEKKPEKKEEKKEEKKDKK